MKNQSIDKESLYRKQTVKSSPRRKTVRILVMVLCVTAALFYLLFTWNKYKTRYSSEAIILAQSLEAIFHPEDIAKLSGGSEDLQKPEYIMIKRSMMRLVQTTNSIEFAYLMGQKAGNIVFLADSEQPDSPDYSPPGQVYEEASKTLSDAFRIKNTVFEGPVKDRWGYWVSVLTPVVDPASGQIIAVLGFDFPAADWYHDLWHQMIPDMIIILFFMLFVAALLIAEIHYIELRSVSSKLAFDEALFRSVYNQAPIGIAIVNDKSFATQSEVGVDSVNPMFQKILGRTGRELVGIDWPDITHPDDLQADIDLFEQFKAGIIDGYNIVKRFLKPDGTYIWTLMTISHFMDEFRNSPMHLCLLMDITAEKEALAALSESERSKSILLTNFPGLAYRCSYDRFWTMRYISEGCRELTGYAPESLINNRDISYNDLIAPEYKDIIWKEWVYALDKNQQFKLDYEIITAGGERKWVYEIGKSVLNEKGEAQYLEGIIFDISENKETEKKLMYNSTHDRVTGLYNRTHFDELIIKDHKEHHMLKRALVGINMNEMLSLTLTYGYYYSEEFAIYIAQTLNRFVSETRILGRTYEHRFVYYIKGYENKYELLDFASKVADTLAPILAAERISAGIGVYEINPEEDLDLNRISRLVMIVSEKASELDDKEIGIRFYDEVIEEQIKREEAIKRELTNIANQKEGDLYLQYQPILDLKTNMICGFEALARLKTEELGPVPPAQFIPIAEKSRLIIPVGWEITRQAFSFLNRLRSLGYDEIYVTVNVSAIQLVKDDFTDKLFEMIFEMDVNPKNVGIEITESVFASDYSEINKVMDRLRYNGLSVAIDDFGTGYSSLSREHELSIDCVKIDKSFIDRIVNVSCGSLITGDIISIAHTLGYSTIAEGVEYEEQKEYLQKNGCDKIQGYLISKPLDEQDAIEFLKKQTYKSAHVSQDPVTV